MPGLGQDEAGLAALHPEPVREQAGVVWAPVRRGGVHLGVQALQLVRVLGGRPPPSSWNVISGAGTTTLSTRRPRATRPGIEGITT